MVNNFIYILVTITVFIKPNTILGIMKNKRSFFCPQSWYIRHVQFTHTFSKQTLKIVGYFWFETGSHYLAQADLKLSTLLPQPSRALGLY